jgi:hypothetical protein
MSEQNVVGDAAQQMEMCILSSVEDYNRIRTGPELWKWCHGKSVLGKLAGELGMQTSILERRVMKLWTDGLLPWPDPIVELRAWLECLQPAQVPWKVPRDI